MLAAWGDSTEEEEGTEEEEATVALMARSDSETDEESLDSLDQLKEQVCGLSKAKLEELLFTLMDECDALVSKNCMLRPCFFGWLKQFNHSHPPSTNFNQLQPLLSTTKFYCNHSQPTSTYFNQLHPFTTPYLPLKETDPK